MARRGGTPRRAGETAEAICDGLLLIAVATAILPSSPLAWALAAALATIPAWVRVFARGRPGGRSFVPDPRRPDFSALAHAFADSAGEAAVEGHDILWTLCPYCTRAGRFRPYTLEPDTGTGSIAVGTGTSVATEKLLCAIRIRMPVPVMVFNNPVSVLLSATGTRGEVYMRAPHLFHLPWNNPLGNTFRRQTVLFLIAVPQLLHAMFQESAILSPERVVVLTILVLAFALRRN